MSVLHVTFHSCKTQSEDEEKRLSFVFQWLEATFDLTFKDPAPPSGMEFECSVRSHYEMGMHIDITVK